MRLRAEAMLKIDETMMTLSKEDQDAVAFEVWRTYGNTTGTHVLTPPKTRVLPSDLTRVNTSNGTAKHVDSVSGNLQGGGSAVAVSKKRDPQLDQDSLEVLQFLNLKASKCFRPVEENLRFIRARLNTCTVADLKGVIARKTREWLNTPDAKYLRPATLFNATKFEQYIGEQNP